MQKGLQILTNNGVLELNNSIQCKAKEFNRQIIVQVLETKFYQDTIPLYKCYITDSVYKLVVLILHDSNSGKIEENDIIKISKVTAGSTNSNQNKMAVVKKYEILHKMNIEGDLDLNQNDTDIVLSEIQKLAQDKQANDYSSDSESINESRNMRNWENSSGNRKEIFPEYLRNFPNRSLEELVEKKNMIAEIKQTSKINTLQIQTINMNTINKNKLVNKISSDSLGYFDNETGNLPFIRNGKNLNLDLDSDQYLINKKSGNLGSSQNPLIKQNQNFVKENYGNFNNYKDEISNPNLFKANKNPIISARYNNGINEDNFINLVDDVKEKYILQKPNNFSYSNSIKFFSSTEDNNQNNSENNKKSNCVNPYRNKIGMNGNISNNGNLNFFNMNNIPHDYDFNEEYPIQRNNFQIQQNSLQSNYTPVNYNGNPPLNQNYQFQGYYIRSNEQFIGNSEINMNKFPSQNFINDNCNKFSQKSENYLNQFPTENNFYHLQSMNSLKGNNIKRNNIIEKPIVNSSNFNNFDSGINSNFNHKLSSNLYNTKAVNVDEFFENLIHRRQSQKLITLTQYDKDVFIRVRCLHKTEKRIYQQNKKVFNFNVIDEEGSEMPITCFDIVCEKFFDLIEVNSVYEIFGGYLKINDQKFTRVNSALKLYLDERSIIRKIREVDRSSFGKNVKQSFNIPTQKYNFVKIESIARMPLNKIIDLLCVVLEVKETKTIVSKKSNKSTELKVLKVTDDTFYKVEISIWGRFALENYYPGQILAIRYVKIGEFKGRNLSVCDSVDMQFDPVFPEALEMKRKYQNFRGELKELPHYLNEKYGRDDKGKNIISIKNIIDYLDELVVDNITLGDCMIKAIVISFSHSEKNYYTGCPVCKKKILLEEKLYCVKCNQNYENFVFYFHISLLIMDSTGEISLDILGENAEKLLGVKCDEYRNFYENNEVEKLEQILKNVEQLCFYFTLIPRLALIDNKKTKKFTCVDFTESGENCKNKIDQLSNKFQKYQNENRLEFLQSDAEEYEKNDINRTGTIGNETEGLEFNKKIINEIIKFNEIDKNLKKEDNFSIVIVDDSLENIENCDDAQLDIHVDTENSVESPKDHE